MGARGATARGEGAHVSRNPPWLVTVPSVVRDGEVVSVGYDEERKLAHIEIPYVRTLKDVDEATLYRAAGEFATMVSYRVRDYVVRAHVAGYLSRLIDERRARVEVKRDAFAGIVRVATGWPVFDMRRPLAGEEWRP